MRLRIATPARMVVDALDVRHVRAEDTTGAFGVLPGHADFVTKLSVAVLTWRDNRGAEHHVALRGGVFHVHGGQTIEVASPEAVRGDRLDELAHAVLAQMRESAQAEAKARTRAAQLHASVVRHLYRYVRIDRGETTGSAYGPDLESSVR
jgi:F-type H+-transporting ATPase subunit epsilon